MWQNAQIVKNLKKISSISNEFSIIQFTFNKIIENEYVFRFYKYVIVWISISFEFLLIEHVINSKCEMSLINEKYFVEILFHVKSIFMSISINVREIKSFTHVFKNYVIIDFYLKDVSEHESTKKKCIENFTW